MKLTKAQRQALRYVADGEYLSFYDLENLRHLENKGLIEEVKTSFISQTTLRITEAGRAALAGTEKE